MKPNKLHLLHCLAAGLLLAGSLPCQAEDGGGTPGLAQVPLRESTSGVKVVPNIMLLLDDSGSMEDAVCANGGTPQQGQPGGGRGGGGRRGHGGGGSWGTGYVAAPGEPGWWCIKDDGSHYAADSRWHAILDAAKQVFSQLCDEKTAGNPDCIPARAGIFTINGGDFDIQREATGTTPLYSFLQLQSFDAAGKQAFMDKLAYLRNKLRFGIDSAEHGQYYGNGNLSNYMLTPLAGPLSEIGRYYQNQGSLAKAAGEDPVQYSCQRNYTILFTDGDRNISGWYRPDGRMQGRSPASSGSPGYNNADAAVAGPAGAYYDTDLRPGDTGKAVNDVPPADDDLATHQHMTSFFVSVGDIADANAEDLRNAADAGHGYSARPGDPRHGKYYWKLDNASQFVSALKGALSNIAAAEGSGTAAVTDDPERTASAGAQAYEVEYDTADWAGDVTEHRVDAIGTDQDAKEWSAAAQLSATLAKNGWQGRRVLVDSDQGGARKLVPFNEDAFGGQTNADALFKDPAEAGLSQMPSLTDAQKARMTSANLIAWLCGDASNDDIFRGRPTGKPLGDIVHATPVYVDYDGPGSNAGDLVIAGANDGMLHAFDAATGQEAWAWVPSVLAGKLWQLADAGYASKHRFFMDGPLSVREIALGGGKKQWILTGGFGAGAKGYWALDITDKNNPAFLWMAVPGGNGQGIVDAENIGYGLGKAYLAKVGGTWRAILPGGYDTADSHAHVFMLDALSGEHLHDFDTGAGDAAAPDGIGAATFHLANPADGSTSWAFAGDLLGDAWRFDLAGCNSQNCGATKIFDGSADQPITAEMQVSSWDKHVLLFFGTGRYLDVDDLASQEPQAIYSIESGISTGGAVEALKLPITKDRLSAFASDSASGGACSAFPLPGWYLDLPNAKERVYLRAELGAGLLLVSSVVPEASACEAGGQSWLYALDYRGCSSQGQNPQDKKDVVGMYFLGIDAEGYAEFLLQHGDGSTEVFRQQPPKGKQAEGGVGGGERLMWRELETQ
jgi:type IV pilus assembly protein PilY1